MKKHYLQRTVQASLVVLLVMAAVLATASVAMAWSGGEGGGGITPRAMWCLPVECTWTVCDTVCDDGRFYDVYRWQQRCYIDPPGEWYWYQGCNYPTCRRYSGLCD